METFIFEAFCQNNPDKISSVVNTLGEQVTQARAVELAFKALQDCPNRNEGPFPGLGPYWKKDSPAAKTTIGFFFANAAPQPSGLLSAQVWTRVNSYSLGQETTFMGRTVRPLVKSGTVSVLLNYNLFSHALSAFQLEMPESTSVGGVLGAGPDRVETFSDQSLLNLLKTIPEKYPESSPLAARYPNRLDSGTCTGFPLIAITASLHRYAAVLAMLDRNVSVDFDVPTTAEASGFLKDFLEPVAAPAGQTGANFYRVKDDLSCVKFNDKGVPSATANEIMTGYRQKNATAPFFDYFLFSYEQKPGSEDALIRIANKVARASPGTVQYLLLSGKFNLNLAQTGVQATVRSLVGKGADINAKDNQGNTVLKAMMNRGISNEAFRFLSGLGATP